MNCPALLFKKWGYGEAIKCLRKSAEQGYAYAQHNLGVMYYEGKGVTQDYSEAISWYMKSAKQGYPASQNDLGYMHLEGKRVVQDYEEAFKWYKKADEQGHAKATSNLKRIESRILNEDQGSDLASIYEYEAERGDANAQRSLAFMYYKGEGVKKDFAKAAEWFREAAEQGDAKSQLDLGWMYLDGQGVLKDENEAAKWFKMAADQGLEAAAKALEFIPDDVKN
ncbi:MAG: tetratricopeptide repeat protein [Desulfobulbia bacterium]